MDYLCCVSLAKEMKQCLIIRGRLDLVYAYQCENLGREWILQAQVGRKMETTSFAVAANADMHGVHPSRSAKFPRHSLPAAGNCEGAGGAGSRRDRRLRCGIRLHRQGEESEQICSAQRPVGFVDEFYGIDSAGTHRAVVADGRWRNCRVLVLLNYWTDKKREIFVNQSGWWGEQGEGKNAKDQRNRKTK